MCSVIGAILKNLTPEMGVKAEAIMDFVWDAAHQRGHDGRGWTNSMHGNTTGLRSVARSDGHIKNDVPHIRFGMNTMQVIVGNTRAEPTTEFVKEKVHSDQQPYQCGDWSVVHNGTIANDKELRVKGDCLWVNTVIDSAAIPEILNEAECENGDSHPRLWTFREQIRRLKGSFAILASHSDEPGLLFYACNYRPLWYIDTEVGVFFASARTAFPQGYVPQMVQPYTMGMFGYDADGKLVHTTRDIRKPEEKLRALVVCSGGLDSVVAATMMQKQGYEIELIHFQYGSRAEGPEVKAVQACAEALGAVCTLFPLPVYKPSDSKLLQADAAVAGGEEGAEFAHEWVPARNLILLSVATAYAEANGFDTIVLGNNLEEAGAYPDNEPEFIDRFNDLLDFAVGDGKRVRVVMPVGNMMKHEIVAMGLRIGAPLDKTWSCYRAGALHCGSCGPCFMRRTAFEINCADEVIEYAGRE